MGSEAEREEPRRAAVEQGIAGAGRTPKGAARSWRSRGCAVMGSREGVAKIAARRVGMTVDAYKARVDAGEKWCTACKAWHSIASFTSDAYRGDGLSAVCTNARAARSKDRTKVVNWRGWNATARSGDAYQARRRITYLVHGNIIPVPNTLPCFDCGHVFDGDKKSKHEYDHYLGYSADHQLDVQPVCRPCHIKRTLERDEYSHAENRRRDELGRFVE